MWLRTECSFVFNVSVPTPFILMLRPRSGFNQWIASESYTLTPSVPAVDFTDIYGNLCQRLIAPVGEFTIRTSAVISTADQIEACAGAPFVEVQHLPNDTLTYLLASRYCESDRFVEMAQEIVAGITPGYDQVAKIEQWVRDNVRFNPQSHHYQLSAVEVNQVREGVCRDLAHLAIALCRALCIPARMVVGFLHELRPMDFHAWFEAYVGDRWYTFDATQSSPRGGRVTVAYGHDAADVAIFNQFGPALSPDVMQVRVIKLDRAPD